MNRSNTRDPIQVLNHAGDSVSSVEISDYEILTGYGFTLSQLVANSLPFLVASMEKSGRMISELAR